MSEQEPSEWWHPLFAVEALRAISDKCDSGIPLEPHERAYLSKAIKMILAEYAEIEGKEVKPILRADRALGLVPPRGRAAQTLIDRNTRIYNRVEALREVKGRTLEAIYADVAEEANQGNFDSPEAAGEETGGIKYRDSTYRSDGTPQRTATSAENIEKIHRAIAGLPGFRK